MRARTHAHLELVDRAPRLALHRLYARCELRLLCRCLPLTLSELGLGRAEPRAQIGLGLGRRLRGRAPFSQLGLE
jgi:hypothetical protein